MTTSGPPVGLEGLCEYLCPVCLRRGSRVGKMDEVRTSRPTLWIVQDPSKGRRSGGTGGRTRWFDTFTDGLPGSTVNSRDPSGTTSG